jgi:hypothetical protein
MQTMSQEVLPLSCLLGDAPSGYSYQVREKLRTQGWTFLFNDDVKNFPYTTQTIQKHLHEFDEKFCQLDTTQKEEFKNIIFPPNRFGYFSTGRKEGYRFMTGTRIEQFMIPPLVRVERAFYPQKGEFCAIALACDTLCKKIYEMQGKFIFDVKEIDTDRIPLLLEDKRSNFGLFDIVKYHPQSTFSEEFQDTTSQVDEHADPGLFSLSLGSTAPGLEMYDPVSNEWISVPNDVMVLWCGHEVRNVSNKAKPGVHRVQARYSPRLTAWYEVCTKDQIPKRARLIDNETMQDEINKWYLEFKKGISMSKSGPRLQEEVRKHGITKMDMLHLFNTKEKQHKI